MRIAALVLVGLLLVIPTAAAESGVSPEPSAGALEREASLPDGIPLPLAEVRAERPTLVAPLARPNGRRPRIAAKSRPADAVVERKRVRLELWVPQQPINTGDFIPATVRVTNLSGRPMGHASLVGCYSGPLQVQLDISEVFEPTKPRRRQVARFIDQFLTATRMNRVWMAPNGPRILCPGDHGVWRNVPAGWSVTQQVAARAVYPWRDQPLPSGRATVSAMFRFFEGLGTDGRMTDLAVEAPVSIKGHAVGYPSPRELADALLAEPVLLDWVKTRWQNAAIYLNPDYPRSMWTGKSFNGGPAPADYVDFDLQAAGSTCGWFPDVRLDPWTAEVLALENVAHACD